MRTPYLATLVLLLASCGGGGGGAFTPAPGSNLVDLGTVASTVPSSVTGNFPNPLAGAAVVASGTTTGPFALTTPLPLEVPAGTSARLDLVVDPATPGATTGTLTLRWDGAGGSVVRSYDLRANGELVTWNLLTPTLDFGAVDVGASRDLTARLLNLSTLSPVTLTGVAVPGAEFSVVGSPFPLEVAPGDVAEITIRYAPGTEGIDDGQIVVGPSDPGGNVAIPVLAATTSTGLEQVVDFGLQSLDANGRTAVLSVSVPADAISLSLEGWIPATEFSSAYIGLSSLSGPGGKVYENTSSTGAYVWVPGYEIFSTSVPNTDRSDVQLVPGGGTYRFQLRRIYGSGGIMRVRAFIERRSPDIDDLGTLDLNVWLAKGIETTASTAESDSHLLSVIGRIDNILAAQGIRLGDIDYYDVDEERFNEVTTDSEFSDLLQTTSAATETRLNLFFVNVAFGDGVVGVAATVGGPKRNGTTSSGVMSIYDGFTTSTIGLIAAHEIGHFLGLYHTVEQDGSHDFIDDTDDCPATGTDEICSIVGGGYLMHWQAVGGTTITDGQGLVIRGHPLVGPAEGVALTLSNRVILTESDLAELRNLPHNWCGTCSNRLGGEEGE